MGMSTKDYEAQTKVGRFRILETADVALLMDGFEGDDCQWHILEFDDDDNLIRVVGSDGGEPEDQSLVRDWQWVAKELNRVADEARALLARARPYVEHCTEEDQTYGNFHGGDPRQFSPDPECSTEEERALHKVHCEAWDRGEQAKAPPLHTPIDPTRSIAGQIKGADVAVLERNAAGDVIGGYTTKASYGLGVNVWRDEEAIALLAEMDRVGARRSNGEGIDGE